MVCLNHLQRAPGKIRNKSPERGKALTVSWTFILLGCLVILAVLIGHRLEVSPWAGHMAGGGPLGPQVYKQVETAAFSELGTGQKWQ